MRSSVFSLAALATATLVAADVRDILPNDDTQALSSASEFYTALASGVAAGTWGGPSGVPVPYAPNPNGNIDRLYDQITDVTATARKVISEISSFNNEEGVEDAREIEHDFEVVNNEFQYVLEYLTSSDVRKITNSDITAFVNLFGALQELLVDITNRASDFSKIDNTGETLDALSGDIRFFGIVFEKVVYELAIAERANAVGSSQLQGPINGVAAAYSNAAITYQVDQPITLVPVAGAGVAVPTGAPSAGIVSGAAPTFSIPSDGAIPSDQLPGGPLPSLTIPDGAAAGDPSGTIPSGTVPSGAEPIAHDITAVVSSLEEILQDVISFGEGEGKDAVDQIGHGLELVSGELARILEDLLSTDVRKFTELDVTVFQNLFVDIEKFLTALAEKGASLLNVKDASGTLTSLANDLDQFGILIEEIVHELALALKVNVSIVADLEDPIDAVAKAFANVAGVLKVPGTFSLIPLSEGGVPTSILVSLSLPWGGAIPTAIPTGNIPGLNLPSQGAGAAPSGIILPTGNLPVSGILSGVPIPTGSGGLSGALGGLGGALGGLDGNSGLPAGALPTGNTPGGLGGLVPGLVAGIPGVGGAGASGSLPSGELPGASGALPSGALPNGALPGGEVPGASVSLPSGALPSGALPSGALPGGEVPGASVALPSGALPSGALPSGALPGGEVPGASVALPSGALPSGALPSGALPGGEVPGASVALPSGALPSGALPSGALPSGEVPGASVALPSGALPSGALPSGALPGGEVPGASVALPSGALPSGNVPSLGLPGYAAVLPKLLPDDSNPDGAQAPFASGTESWGGPSGVPLPYAPYDGNIDRLYDDITDITASAEQLLDEIVEYNNEEGVEDAREIEHNFEQVSGEFAHIFEDLTAFDVQKITQSDVTAFDNLFVSLQKVLLQLTAKASDFAKIDDTSETIDELSQDLSHFGVYIQEVVYELARAERVNGGALAQLQGPIDALSSAYSQAAATYQLPGTFTLLPLTQGGIPGPVIASLSLGGGGTASVPTGAPKVGAITSIDSPAALPSGVEFLSALASGIAGTLPSGPAPSA